MVTKSPHSSLHLALDFIKLGRPLFLLGGFLLYGLGAVIALTTGARLNLANYFLGQVAVTSIQLMTHYSNEYFDLEADKLNTSPTDWSGGSRVLVEGHIKPRVALITSITMGVIALLAISGLVLFTDVGPLAGPFLLLALFLGWSYSSPPLQLNMRGLGEVTGALLITGFTPLSGFYLQAGSLELLPFLAIFPLCCFQFCMLLIINFPDAAGDAAAGKRTLIHYLGEPKVASLYLMVLLMAYAALPLLVLLGLPLQVAIALLFVSPLALWMGIRMLRGAWARPEQWNRLAFWSIGLLMTSVAAEFLAFLLIAGGVIA
jgi:1,4-dihydroxy-2-naphthoate octaprenyltransferase